MAEPYLFIYDGKYLEYETLVELRIDMTTPEWENLIESTVNIYIMMKGIEKAIKVIDRSDKIAIKRLKRTLAELERIDKLVMLRYDIPKMITEAAQAATQNFAIADEVINQTGEVQTPPDATKVTEL